jgi:hypothetical protein
MMPPVHRDANVGANVIYYAPKRLEHCDSACIPFKPLLESLELQGKGTELSDGHHGAPRPHRHNISGFLHSGETSRGASSSMIQPLASSAAADAGKLRNAVSHDRKQWQKLASS